MTSDLINDRTPEEIKAAVLCTEKGTIPDCPNCPYYGELDENGFRAYHCHQANFDLIAYVEHLESQRDAALAKVLKWISVKERLPKNEKDVLIFGWREGISGKLWPVVMTAFHMDGKVLAQDSNYAWSEGSIEMEYDEDADDFIVPEGWFEDVQCADEFSMVCDIRVTHWMPKPQPPKEE